MEDLSSSKVGNPKTNYLFINNDDALMAEIDHVKGI